MFRRYRRPNGLLWLVLLAVVFSGGLGSVFALGGRNNSRISSYENTNNNYVEYTQPESDADEEAAATPMAIEPTNDNTQQIRHNNDEVLHGNAKKKTAAEFKFTANITGEYYFVLENFYSKECFEVSLYDRYEKKTSVYPPTRVELIAQQEYRIVVEGGNNNVHGDFDLRVTYPDPIVEIDQSKLFVQSDIRFPGQKLEYTFTPTDNGVYEVSIENFTNGIVFSEFYFINSYGHVTGSKSYGPSHTAEAELKAGEAYTLLFESSHRFDNPGTFIFSIKKSTDGGE